MHRTRSVLAASVVLTLGISSFAVARNGDVVTQGARNGTTTKETQIIANVGTTNANTGGFSTRQSNKSSTGGGATYGCRAQAAPANKPCLRANNLSTGLAFEFQATSGTNGGTITVGGGGDAAKPFTTNATGVADGLNADRVDGKGADEIQRGATRWALINEAGQIERQTGGFTVVNCYQTNANCYLDAGEDVRDNGIHAQIAVQNVDNIQGNDVNLSGETGTAPCGTEFVACAPQNTERNEVLVVAPRKSDGTAPNAENRFRFYVFVTAAQSG